MLVFIRHGRARARPFRLHARRRPGECRDPYRGISKSCAMVDVHRRQRRPVVMGLGSRGASHRARIRATGWLIRGDEGIRNLPSPSQRIVAACRFEFARFFQWWAAGSARSGLSGTVSGLSAHFTAGSSQLMHWSSVRPEMATTGSNSFPHFAQRVMHSMTDAPIFRP